MLLFGAQRVAYERFYDVFGITPEDVGIDVTRVLAQTAAGVCLFLVFVGVCVVVYFGLVTHGSRRSRLTLPNTGKIVRGVLVATLGSATFMAWVNWVDADDAAKCAARSDGQSVRSLRFFGITRLGVRADRAVASSTDRTHVPEWDGRHVVYLGTGDGAALLYDPADRRTLRVPVGALTLSTETTAKRFHPRSGCVTPT